MNLIDRVIASFGPEDAEQYRVVQELELLQPKYGLLFTSIPNSTYTKSIMVKTRNRLLGLRPGLCDMLVLYPHHWVLFIEMKREKGGTLSPSQKVWIEALNTVPNVEAHRANGADAALKIVHELLGITK